MDIRKRAKGKNQEFDPGSGRTLAACLTHASRTEIFWKLASDIFEWRTGE